MAEKDGWVTRTIVITPEGLLPTDFDTLQDFARIDNALNAPDQAVYMTQEAHDKYLSFLEGK